MYIGRVNSRRCNRSTKTISQRVAVPTTRGETFFLGGWVRLNVVYNLGQNKWNIWTTPPSLPPFQWCQNGVFLLLRAFIIALGWGWGEGGLLFLFILSKIAILGKINGTSGPPLPPISMLPKWRVFAPSRLLHCFRGKGVNWPFLLCPRLSKAMDVAGVTAQGVP